MPEQFLASEVVWFASPLALDQYDTLLGTICSIFGVGVACSMHVSLLLSLSVRRGHIHFGGRPQSASYTFARFDVRPVAQLNAKDILSSTQEQECYREAQEGAIRQRKCHKIAEVDDTSFACWRNLLLFTLLSAGIPCPQVGKGRRRSGTPSEVVVRSHFRNEVGRTK